MWLIVFVRLVCQLLGGLACVVDCIGVRGVSTIRWSGMCG